MGFFDLFKSGPKHIFNENGENIIYFENEKIVKCKFTKVNGSINGTFLTFYKNIGQTPCMSAEFKNGKLEGSSYEYSITAKMNWLEEEYRNNNVISKKVFYTGFSNRGKLAKDEKYKVEDEADGVIKEGVYAILEKYNISNKIFEDIISEESNINPEKVVVKDKLKDGDDVSLVDDSIDTTSKRTTDDIKTFNYANLKFKYNYNEFLEKISSYHDEHDLDYDGDKDEYTLYENAYTGDEIINELFPGKYIALSYYVYYGTFNHKGEEAEDIAEYSDGNDSIFYVGGAYNEDRSKEVDSEVFWKLHDDEVMVQEPKYQELKFIDSKGYTNLRDLHTKENNENKEKFGPHDLPDWVENPVGVMTNYNIENKKIITTLTNELNQELLTGIFCEIMGTEVYMFEKIFDIEKKIQNKVRFRDIVFLESLREEGYEKFKLPLYIAKDLDEFNRTGRMDLPSKKEEEIFEKLAKKYDKDPGILRWYTAHKDFKLPDIQTFLKENWKNGIQEINNCVTWFRNNNLLAYKIIMNKLYEESNICLWKIYPSLIIKGEDDMFKYAEFKNNMKSFTKEFEIYEDYEKFKEEISDKSIDSFVDEKPSKEDVINQYKINNDLPPTVKLTPDGPDLFKRDMSGLSAYFEQMTNMERIFNELTTAIRNGSSVWKYLNEANLLNDDEIREIAAKGFSDVASFLKDSLSITENTELRKDYDACIEAIEILRKK